MNTIVDDITSILFHSLLYIICLLGTIVLALYCF